MSGQSTGGHGITATLQRRTEIAEGTWELDFDLGGERLDFRAGQYCRVGLPSLGGSRKQRSRKFSIVNAPHDDGRLIIATRAGITDYKCSLCALQPGAVAEVEKVKGKLVLPDRPARPLLFVAGGIGVVPFVSMLRDLAHRDRLAAVTVTMLYFNRTAASAAYVQELESLAATHPDFTLVLAMTRDPDWPGETARLSRESLLRLLGDAGGYDCYVVGTPAMVDAAGAALKAAGVPRDQILDEDFSGYSSAA